MSDPQVFEILGQTFTRERLIWDAIAMGGQLMFSSRFLVQWVASERAKSSVVPKAFWYLSLAGGVVLLVYALFGIHSLPIILGQAMGLVVYTRNLVLIRRSEARLQAGAG